MLIRRIKAKWKRWLINYKLKNTPGLIIDRVGIHLQPDVNFLINSGCCILKQNVAAREHLTICVDESGQLEIGEKTFFNVNGYVACREKITIGKNCLFGPNVVIVDHDHDMQATEPGRCFIKASVAIGDNVWVGANAVITKGVSIGNNCIIGAGAVVTHDIPSNAVAAGIPARVIRLGEDNEYQRDD